MEKSHVSLETHICLVCGCTYQTGDLLLKKDMRPTLNNETLTGNGLCDEHQKKYDEEYIALIEIDPDKSTHLTKKHLLKPGEAYRTGKIFHLSLKAFKQIFDTKTTYEVEGKIKMIPMIFIEPEVSAKLHGIIAATSKSPE